jgi:VanZ family protein
MRKARYFIPAILFYLFIFFLSSQSVDIDLPLPGLDMAAHFVEFALFGFLLSIGYFKAFGFSDFLKSVLVFLTGLPLGALDELHQLFVPGRKGSIGDIAADAAGLVCGILVFRFLAKRRRPTPTDRTAA